MRLTQLPLVLANLTLAFAAPSLLKAAETSAKKVVEKPTISHVTPTRCPSRPPPSCQTMPPSPRSPPP
ncbi:MAG: hypothetical protein H7343_21950 [Undibacterium sp.]|nr:hypothetical protein [Opitutaceae bacterium]